MANKPQKGDVAEGVYFDGEVFFVRCIMCGHEQGDMGKNVACEECGAGPMPTAEDLDFDI